jgi:hypothetical protein
MRMLLLVVLLAPQPAEPQMKTCAGNVAATLRPEQPYRVLWNAAWPEKCAGYAPPPNISSFGIDTNGGPNSTREGVAICTPGPSPIPKSLGTGLYPNYGCLHGYPFDEKNCQPIHGGSPQLANLSAHLEAFKQDVVRLMPDPNAATAINLDWEKWDPTWAGTLPERKSMCGSNGTCVTKPYVIYRFSTCASFFARSSDRFAGHAGCTTASTASVSCHDITEAISFLSSKPQ